MSIAAQAIQKALALSRPNAQRAGAGPRHRVLLSPAGDGLLDLICADETTETSVRIPGSVDAGIALAPQFCDLVQTLAADASIKLSDGGKGACKVQTGRSRFSVPSAPPQDFPRLVDEDKEAAVAVTLNASALARGIQAARNGLGKADKAHDFGTGILFKTTATGAFLAATNRYKLVAVSVAASTAGESSAAQGVIPEMGVLQIERLARSLDSNASIELRMGQRHVVASAGQAVIRSRLISCAFPDYSKVVAMQNPPTVNVARTQLVSILKRVGLFVTEKSPFITLKLEGGKLTCSVKTAAGECNESMDVATSAPSLEQNVNIGYLCSILDAMPDDSISLDFGATVLRARGTSQIYNAVAVAAYYKA